jgi:hypothetical protein
MSEREVVLTGPARLSRGWSSGKWGREGKTGGVVERMEGVGTAREAAREVAREVVDEAGSGGGTPYGE